MQLTIFEGVSGSGKTTLKEPLHNALDHSNLYIHRLTASQWVYDVLRGTPTEVPVLNALERSLERVLPTLVVWCRCAPKVAAERKARQGDLLVEDLAQADALFSIYFSELTRFTNILELRTDKLSVQECVDRIKEELA